MDRDGGGGLLGECVPQNGNCAYDCEREREKESWKKEEGSLKEKQSYLKGVSNRKTYLWLFVGEFVHVYVIFYRLNIFSSIEHFSGTSVSFVSKIEGI